mmetsp:Transcript_20917/g.57913  ORF Transcript_20917/g.57913 Transcript_20917/m.57913 type:complete len:319 (-) Transcript_20917:1574-2530(-)
MVRGPADTLGDIGQEPAQRVDSGARCHARASLLRGLRALEAEALEQADEGHLGLQQSEVVTNAFAGAAAEGHEGKVRGDLVGVEASLLGVEAPPPALALQGLLPTPRIELGRVLAPQLRGALQGPRGDEDVLAGQERHGVAGDPSARGANGDLVAVLATADQQRRLRVEPQGLQQAPLQDRQFSKVLECGLTVANHSVHLLEKLLELVRVFGLHELVQRPREQRRGGLMPSDEQGHQVVPQLPRGDVLVLRHHEVLEQGGVLSFCGLLHGVADELVEHGVQEHEVLLVRLLVPEHVGRAGEIPVGDHGLCPALSLAQH